VPDRILTLRALNRATLARQMLLERAALPIAEAVERAAGLQAQVPAPPFVGLWTRLPDFGRDDLTALLERREIVRATLMRSTIHLVTADDYALFRPALQPALDRALSAFFGKRAKGLDAERIVSAARASLEEEPRTFAELRGLLSGLYPGADPDAMGYVVRTRLPLVQIPSGAWGYSGNIRYTLAEDWLERPLADPEMGFRHLVHRYLAAFGPATVQDLQAWSGLVRLKDWMEELRPELRAYRDERGRELLDLPDAPLPDPDRPVPPRFMPEYDNLVLSHADRTRVIADADRPKVFLSAGRVRSTILVDGFVRGAWGIERARGSATLLIEPFAPLAKEERSALAQEGERLVRFVEDGAESVDVRFAREI
jgi:hypothetical protein